MITAGSFSKVDPGHHFTVESFPHFWLGWLWSVLAFDFLEDNLCDVTSRHSVTAYHGGRYLVESITLVEVVIKNMRVLKRHDKFIPSEVARTKRFLKKKKSVYSPSVQSVSVQDTHTQLTHYRYSAGVAWAECHMWRPAPAAGLALNTQPAAISLTHPVNPTLSICPLCLHLWESGCVLLVDTHTHR